MFSLRQGDGETDKLSEEGSDISLLSSETRFDLKPLPKLKKNIIVRR